MSIDIENLVTTFLSLTIVVYMVSFLLYLVRVVKGPTISDMIIAVDALGFDLAAFFVILSILFKAPVLIGCAVVLALWIYALDIYVSKYLEYEELGD